MANKMKYYLAGFAHENGFGRRSFGTRLPVTDALIAEWEKHCADGVNNKVSIIAISPIDGIDNPTPFDMPA